MREVVAIDAPRRRHTLDLVAAMLRASSAWRSQMLAFGPFSAQPATRTSAFGAMILVERRLANRRRPPASASLDVAKCRGSGPCRRGSAPPPSLWQAFITVGGIAAARAAGIPIVSDVIAPGVGPREGERAELVKSGFSRAGTVVRVE